MQNRKITTVAYVFSFLSTPAYLLFALFFLLCKSLLRLLSCPVQILKGKMKLIGLHDVVSKKIISEASSEQSLSLLIGRIQFVRIFISAIS